MRVSRTVLSLKPAVGRQARRSNCNNIRPSRQCSRHDRLAILAKVKKDWDPNGNEHQRYHSRCENNHGYLGLVPFAYELQAFAIREILDLIG